MPYLHPADPGNRLARGVSNVKPFKYEKEYGVCRPCHPTIDSRSHRRIVLHRDRQRYTGYCFAHPGRRLYTDQFYQFLPVVRAVWIKYL